MSKALHLVQVSDTHLFADPSGKLLGLVTSDSFQATLAAVKALEPPPDLILLTGDLAQDHKAKTYIYLRHLLAPLNIPIHWIPGNHDEPTLMDELLRQPPFYTGKIIQSKGWQIILLDSHVHGQVHGLLTPESLAALDQQLTTAPKIPTLLALHHPPFTVGAKWLDSSRLQNPDDLFTVIDRHDQIRLVIFGHIHQEFQHQRHRVTYLGTPSTCIQFLPRSQEFGLEPVGPGFRQLWLYPDGAWQTQVNRINFQTLVDAAATGY